MRSTTIRSLSTLASALMGLLACLVFLPLTAFASIASYSSLESWTAAIPYQAAPTTLMVSGSPNTTTPNRVELPGGLDVAIVTGSRMYYGSNGDQLCIEPNGVDGSRFELFTDAQTRSLAFKILTNGQVEVGAYAVADGTLLGYSVETLTGTTEFRGYVVDGLTQEVFVIGYDPNAVICLGPFYVVPDIDSDGTAGDGDCTELGDQDGDGSPACNDCNDANGDVVPNGGERCNGIDDDCDGMVDGADVQTFGTTCYDDDGDGWTDDAGDCNDDDVQVSPSEDEVPYDGVDNDCKPETSDTDTDGDGYPALSAGGADCDDNDAAVHPNAEEIVNSVDDDCDGKVDDGTAVYDDDGDGYAETDNDCDDENVNVNPGATETCNTTDDDCDGIVDEDTRCHDDDGDGYSENGGDCDDGYDLAYPGADEIPYDGADNDCSGDGDVDDVDGDGYAAEQAGGTDCNDGNANVNPAAPEPLNGVDDDCDGKVDDGTAVYDDDGDGFCEVDSCVGGLPSGDCNDDNAGVNPDAAETCNTFDDDCDGTTDEGFDLNGNGSPDCLETDLDGDGYSLDDCEPYESTAHPGGIEVCDELDNDCSGSVDEGTECFDDDGDGYSEDGSVGGSDDCDDTDETVNPGAEEIEGDGVDNDCDPRTFDDPPTPVEETETPEESPTEGVTETPEVGETEPTAEPTDPETQEPTSPEVTPTTEDETEMTATPSEGTPEPTNPPQPEETETPTPPSGDESPTPTAEGETVGNGLTGLEFGSGTGCGCSSTTTHGGPFSGLIRLLVGLWYLAVYRWPRNHRRR